LEELKLYYN